MKITACIEEPARPSLLKYIDNEFVKFALENHWQLHKKCIKNCYVVKTDHLSLNSIIGIHKNEYYKKLDEVENFINKYIGGSYCYVVLEYHYFNRIDDALLFKLEFENYKSL